MQEANLTDVYRLENFSDTFALGHYARVLDAIDRRTGQKVAFKVLRPEHLTPGEEPNWEYCAFGNEADLLMKMSGSKHVIRLLDCGYVSAEDERPVSGRILSYQVDVLGFIRDMVTLSEQGWRPYLALENLPRTRNLLYLMKTTSSDVRWRLPTEEGLDLALQFAAVLKLAHQQRIVYLDHKLEHVYWDGHTLRVIDWNSSRQIEDTSTITARMFQIDLHHLAVGVLYPVFTGLSPRQGALLPQPASPEALGQRYVDIQHLDFGVEPTLSRALQDVLQKAAAQAISSVEELMDDLAGVAGRFGWDFPHRPAADSLRESRTFTRAGLKRLREGQNAIREARDLLREAAVLDGINDDVKAELHRLLGEINAMLARRVIP